MREYTNPEIEIVEIKSADVITASPGTETGKYEIADGIWDLDIN